MGIEDFPTIQIPQGVLRGQRVPLKDGGHYFSFQGIPYAKPPVGARRFKVAESPEPWHGVRDALQEGNVGPQIEWYLNRPYRGEEDCLYLNVYTPKLPSIAERVRKPVMVWIHGGGFETGSGDRDYYGPQYLVAEDVVLVTINYRLSILGFLSLDDPLLPANLGMKDQVGALRWVKANIEVFGGDANNVTIFGESAGGASVHYHMLSPMSRGLFHKAIMQSGCVFNPWAMTENSKRHAFEVAAALGCQTTNTQELLKFLTDVPAKVLIETLDKLRMEENSMAELIKFGPVPERNVRPGEEIFLPAHPRELMEKGQFSSVPCIIGVTSQESIAFLGVLGFHRNPDLVKYFIDNIETQLPIDPISKLSQKELAISLRSFYLKNSNSPSDSLGALLNLYSDAWFTRGVNETVKILSRTSPTFYYNFSFSGQRNLLKNFLKTSSLKGAAHFDDVGYLFESLFFKVPEAKPKSKEWKTLKRLVTMWTNFAKTGNPTPSIDDVINVQWPPYTTSNPVYLNIDEELSVNIGLHSEKFELWNKL